MNKMFENAALKVFIQFNFEDEFIFLSYFKIDSKKISERNQVEVQESKLFKDFFEASKKLETQSVLYINENEKFNEDFAVHGRNKRMEERLQKDLIYEKYRLEAMKRDAQR